MNLRVVPPARFPEACLAALVSAVTGHANPVVGLPTGNTPIGLFRALAARARSGVVDVSTWRPFAIDEYCGPRDHPCSNRAFFARYWESIPGTRPVEQFDPESPDLHAEAHHLAGRLAAAGGLDVALLGVGMNGHLAFNEPGSSRDSTARVMELHEASRRSARACWGEETPAFGLTLGLRELLGAGRVVVIANGAAKAGIVRLALEGPCTEDCPASLTTSSPNTTWVLDTAAASRLPRRL